MAKRQKYYVVWVGRTPGVYASWETCKAQVDGVAGARYKSYPTEQEARAALQAGPEASGLFDHASNTRQPKTSALLIDDQGMTILRPGVNPAPTLDALAVDAACSGNPGVMEYQGIYIPTRTRVFHYRAEKGTNNIGEFLAIVHGLSYLKRHRLNQVLYSDSANAISWVRQRLCKSKLPLDPTTADLWDYVHRAEAWLRQNTYSTPILKWNTELWGEIPADFGRK